MKRSCIYAIIIITLSLIPISVYWYPAPQPTLTPSSFAKLPGWETAQVKPSLTAFLQSCESFMKQNPEKRIGTKNVPVRVKDWQPACRAAMSVDPGSDEAIRTFFQTWFTPVAFSHGKPAHSLFTGYFMPLLKGSLHKTKEYSVPVYGLPAKKHVPSFTREQINQGALRNIAPVIVWIKSAADRVFLEIEGSGAIDLVDNGKRMFVSYAGENGKHYTSIASVLIKQGVMTRDTASSKHIKHYLDEHPEKVDHILNQNKSFVFFSRMKNDAALGAQGVDLTPGYSLAVDPKWIPYGTPTWLSTTIPTKDDNSKKPFNRLMVAQDTGGAIRGKVRGDVYWGAGKIASFMASHMQEHGQYWLLLPRHIAKSVKV